MDMIIFVMEMRFFLFLCWLMLK